MKTAQIRGYMVPNDIKWVYDWYEIEATCPKDIKDAIKELEPEEEMQIMVNSPGGAVTCGQEIYAILRTCKNTTAIVESEACSAASVAIMGAERVIMSPAGLIMIHNSALGGYIGGDKNEFEKIVGMLSETDRAIASAYRYKTGMEESELLELMNRETWLTADRAVELGFADEIMSDKSKLEAVAAYEALPVTDEMIKQAKAEMEKRETEAKKQEVLSDLYLYGI